MPSELETALNEIIAVFYEFSSQDGNKNHLTIGELQKLLSDELKMPQWTIKDPAYVEKILKSLDENKDGQVSFQEYVDLVIGFILAYNDFYNKT